MILAFHQPNHLPNLGFFYKLLMSDIFIIVTNIQFEKTEGWQRRHKIKGKDKDYWLTVPVLGSQNQKIKDVKINNTVRWKEKNIKTLYYAYSKTPEKKFMEKKGATLLKLPSAEEEMWVRDNYATGVAHNAWSEKS